MKLKPFKSGEIEGYSFFCPGCDHPHVYYTTGKVAWDFNGNLEAPTFTPSLLNTTANPANPKQDRCHLFMTAGKLQFCSDCSHELAGQTVDLPDYPNWENEES